MQMGSSHPEAHSEAFVFLGRRQREIWGLFVIKAKMKMTDFPLLTTLTLPENHITNVFGNITQLSKPSYTLST